MTTSGASSSNHHLGATSLGDCGGVVVAIVGNHQQAVAFAQLRPNRVDRLADAERFVVRGHDHGDSQPARGIGGICGPAPARQKRRGALHAEYQYRQQQKRRANDENHIQQFSQHDFPSLSPKGIPPDPRHEYDS
jgi:hypothetical protein